MPVMKVPLLVAGALLAAGAARVAGQQAAPPDAAPLAVGTVAPDFSVPGATRYGVLARPIHLSDFRGKTVVLAFFFKARTKG
jgi:AhpC/TSA family